MATSAARAVLVLSAEVVEAMDSKIPAWLYDALDQALLDAGATAPEESRRAVLDRLISAWNLKGRHFHNSRYLAHVFERIDELEGATSCPELLRLAIAFRGAIDEIGWEESDLLPTPVAIPAMVSLQDLTDLGIPGEQSQRIEDLILELARHRAREEDLEAKILIDADLAALAAPPQRYRDFLENLRLEAENLSEEEFLRRRHHAVSNLLARTQIFSTPVAAQWEDAARENLEAELAATERKLARLRGRQGVEPSAAPESSERSRPQAGASTPSPSRRESRVLRISRAQKSQRLRDGAEAVPSRTVAEGVRQDQTSPNPKPASRPAVSPEGGDAAGRAVALHVGADDQTTNTSTLELVADLVEMARARARKSGGRGPAQN